MDLQPDHPKSDIKAIPTVQWAQKSGFSPYFMVQSSYWAGNGP